MKMAKASETDITAAGDAMSVLNDISSGYYPKRGDDEDQPTFFDADNPAHLRHFYELINATLDISPGWPGRVIGGMCFVILYEKNEILDPSSDVLELHPKFDKLREQRDQMLAALKGVVRVADRETVEFDAARAAIAEAESEAGTIDMFAGQEGGAA